MDHLSPSDYGLERESLIADPGQVLHTPPAPKPQPVPDFLAADPLQQHAVLREQSTPRATALSYRKRPECEVTGTSKSRTQRKVDGPERNPEREKAPRRPSRSSHLAREIGLELRPEERRLLQEIGKFRIIAMRDAGEFIYGGNESAVRRDTTYLAEKGLVEVHRLNARRDGRDGEASRFEALTITKRGRKLVQQSGDLSPDQRIYAGLVKPKEAEHDTQIYRAFQKEIGKIENNGGRNARVRLDFELKAQMNRSVYLARKSDPQRDPAAVKAEIAQKMDLEISNDRVVVPDLRIEYDIPGGGSSHTDVEVATAAYRQGHIAAKARAGMRIYASHGDIGRLGAAIQDDHDIMSEILTL